MAEENQVDSIRDLLENARGIVLMPAFKAWEEQINGQIEGRRAEILKPAHEANGGSMGQEYMKGEVIGMMHAVGQWKLLIDYLDGEYKQRLADVNSKENTNDDET